MTRIAALEASNLRLSNALKDTSVVVAECVYATQLLLEKGIITRDEIKSKRHTFHNPDSESGEGGGVQPEDAGTDVDSSGRGQPGVSDEPGDRGDPDGIVVLKKSAGVGWSELPSLPEQSDPDAPVSES